MKTCFKCNQELPFTSFYRHPQMADGYCGKCKACARADSEARRVQKEADPVWRERELERQRVKTRRYVAAGRVSKRTPEQQRETQRRHRAKHPEKDRARDMVAHAIKAGLLSKQPCESCASADSEAHHDDYAQPLTVRWLCPKHHAARHVELRKLQRLHH